MKITSDGMIKVVWARSRVTVPPHMFTYDVKPRSRIEDTAGLDFHTQKNGWRRINMRRRVQRGDYYPDFRQPVSFHRQVRSYLRAAGPNCIRTPDKEEAAEVKAASNRASVSLSLPDTLRHCSLKQSYSLTYYR